jgi:hypothetical protein
MPKESLDPVLDTIIPELPQLTQVQYDLTTQMAYLKRIAVRYGLYDAADYLHKVFNV